MKRHRPGSVCAVRFLGLAVLLATGLAQAAAAWVAEWPLESGSARVERIPLDPFSARHRLRLRLTGACALEHDLAVFGDAVALGVWRKDATHYALTDARHALLIDRAQCRVVTIVRPMRDVPAMVEVPPASGYLRVGRIGGGADSPWRYWPESVSGR